nr:MAG TPA: hypothetical protein [Caudoviricetes sp.]
MKKQFCIHFFEILNLDLIYKWHPCVYTINKKLPW